MSASNSSTKPGARCVDHHRPFGARSWRHDRSQWRHLHRHKQAIANVVLPRRYYPAWQGNLFERRAESIAEQLCGEGMTIDFDQLLAKQPGRADAVFAWHQDQAYWIGTDDRRTGTCWLAVDDSTLENGCMQFLSGSHREPLRPHFPVGEDRAKVHTIATSLGDGDEVVSVPIRRGDVTVHNEGVLHGSGGNTSAASWRRAYIVALRSVDTVKQERALGFTHSHNDSLDLLDNVDDLRAARNGEMRSDSHKE